MKKIVLFAALMVATLTANAQEAGKMAVGANLSYGMHKDYKNIGFGAKFQYNFTDAIRGEASGNYFLKKDHCTMWDVNINAHYVINVAEGLNVYPLAGLTILGAKTDFNDITGGHDLNYYYNEAKQTFIANGGTEDLWDAAWEQVKAQYEGMVGDTVGESSSKTKFGFNVGAGIEYFISDNLKVNAEVKYQYVKDFDRPVISAGISYVF